LLRTILERRTLRILVADDFHYWRALVRNLLGASPELQIIDEACNGLEAVQKAVELGPDLVLLDLGMPILDGIAAAKRIRQACPRCKLIFLSQNSDTEVRGAALSVGAEAYVLKTDAARELLPAIQAAMGRVGSGSNLQPAPASVAPEQIPS
jgi:DNA-binding NarL/FixJ family response regulator